MPPMHNLYLVRVLPSQMPQAIEVDNVVISASAVDAQTALAGGAQAGTAITKAMVRFTTVVTAGDSAQLPPAIPGIHITLKNATANSMNVFPQTGESINALAANAAFAVATVKLAYFECIKTGVWEAVAL
jgi:hypothetical protein